MNDILTNGSEIKKRIVSEIQKANQNIYLAMAWFTDRNIANAIIDAKNRSLKVDIILSSNAQNETVKQMFKEANISVHAFETGDERGMMHHKFCLIDNKITLNGSYNYSYNASNNNVENIQVSEDLNTYRQLYSEFERLKYNIDNDIDLNVFNKIIEKPTIIQPAHAVNTSNSLSQQLSNLVYATANINTDEFKRQGPENSKESAGNIEIFKSNYGNIKGQIKNYATDDGLSSTKNTLLCNINAAFESKKNEIEVNKLSEFNTVNDITTFEIKQINALIIGIKQEKAILESGDKNTGEKGLLQINNETEKNKLERRSLESSFNVKKFWSIGPLFAIIGLCVFIFYLSIFFSSAMYKVFFEGNVIRNSLQAGINPGLPQLVDANAILKIFKVQGVLFGLMAALFFLIPLLMSIFKKTQLIIVFITFVYCTQGIAQQYPEMITVEGGTFNMGDSEMEGDADQQPSHEVTLTTFLIAKTETTVAQYRAYCTTTGKSMPKPPSWGWIDSHPMVNVTWHDAVAYTDWLAEKTGKNYRLPTEAEWKYAAFGGTKSNGNKYAGGRSLDLVGWYQDNSNNRTHPVAQKRANELGIYDMSGNVLERCKDWYGADYYSSSPKENPQGPSLGTHRVKHGGSWACDPTACRVAHRSYGGPYDRGSAVGFRVALSK